MIIDLQIHEKTHSSDSVAGLKEIMGRAEKIGLDAVCITDHDSMGLAEAAYEASCQMNFPESKKSGPADASASTNRAGRLFFLSVPSQMSAGSRCV